jgi:hypothetical protein
MAWPEIIATGAVTLVGGLGGVVLTSRYQTKQSRGAERRAQVQAENQRILELAEAGLEVARDLQTMAMHHFMRQSGAATKLPDAVRSAFDDAQF